MNNLPTRPTNNLPTDRAAPSPAIPDQETGTINYQPCEVVGFEKLPQTVRQEVQRFLIGSWVASDARDPVVKRRPDGSHYQEATGWWASNQRYVEIVARRELTPKGRGLAPIEGWKTTWNASLFERGTKAVPSYWPLDADGQGGVQAPPKNKYVKNVISVLPADLVAPLQGVKGDASRRYENGAEETIVAARVTEGQVVVVRAWRHNTCDEALDLTGWQALTLTATVVQPGLPELPRKGIGRLLNRKATAAPIPALGGPKVRAGHGLPT